MTAITNPILSGARYALAATQVPSADANTIDDYEEGVYTAAITCSTSGTITVNASFDQLQYTKVGRMVHVHGQIRVSSVSAPVGVLQVSLPFVAGAGTELSAYAAASVAINAAVAGFVGTPQGFVAGTGSVVSIYEFAAGGITGAAARMQAGTEIYLSVVYST